MATVDKYLVGLLQEEDWVILPGFGGFIAQYKPVSIHPVRHLMSPPAKTIAFTAQIKHDDRKLASYIAQQKQLPEQEAKEQVLFFVENLKHRLQADRTYTIKNLGLFKTTFENEIEFEFQPALNFLADSFGLPEISAAPIIKPKSMQEVNASINKHISQVLPDLQATKPGFWKKTLRYAAVLPLLLAGSLAVVFTVKNRAFISDRLQQSTTAFQFQLPAFSNNTQTTDNTYFIGSDYLSALQVTAYEQLNTFNQPAEENAELDKLNKSSFLSENTETQITVTEKAQEEIAKNELEQVSVSQASVSSLIEPLVSADNNTIVPERVEAVNGRFYIIAGGFTDFKNAVHMQQMAENKGVQATILEPKGSNTLNRVSLADFSTKEEALAALDSYKKTFGKAVWLLSYTQE